MGIVSVFPFLNRLSSSHPLLQISILSVSTAALESHTAVMRQHSITQCVLIKSRSPCLWYDWLLCGPLQCVFKIETLLRTLSCQQVPETSRAAGGRGSVGQQLPLKTIITVPSILCPLYGGSNPSNIVAGKLCGSANNSFSSSQQGHGG